MNTMDSSARLIRGFWTIPSTWALGIAIGVSAVHTCWPLAGAVATAQADAMLPDPSRGLFFYVSAALVAAAVWIAVQWLFLWRRWVHLSSPSLRYWIWTGIHSVFAGAMLVNAFKALVVLPRVIQVASVAGQSMVVLSAGSTLCEAIAAAGWILLILVVPRGNPFANGSAS